MMKDDRRIRFLLAHEVLGLDVFQAGQEIKEVDDIDFSSKEDVHISIEGKLVNVPDYERNLHYAWQLVEWLRENGNPTQLAKFHEWFEKSRLYACTEKEAAFKISMELLYLVVLGL